MRSDLLSVVVVVVGLAASVDGARGQSDGPAAPVAASGQPRLDADPHLVAWWKMDEASGATAADASGRGHHGTLRDALSFDSASVEGRVGKALGLDGKRGFIEVPGFKGVTGTQPRTIAVWLKTKQNRGEVVCWGEDDGGKMCSVCFIRGHIGLTPQGGYYYTGVRIDDDRWHHVAIVVTEGAPPNLHDNVTIYVDGSVAKVHDIGLLDLWPVETGSGIDVRVGRGFAGAIDELRIYDRALSEDEVKTLGAAGTE